MISKLVCYCIFDIFVLTFEVQFSWDLLANLVDIEDFLASRISVHDINHNILRESFSICKCISSLCRDVFSTLMKGQKSCMPNLVCLKIVVGDAGTCFMTSTFLLICNLFLLSLPYVDMVSKCKTFAFSLFIA